MKIKVIEKPYDEVMALPRPKHVRPKKPNFFFRTLMKLVSLPDMRKHHFKCEKVGMEKLGKNESALYLMNHSCFIDLEVVATLMYPRPFNIVTTTDAFIGKEWLMKQIGCIPTKKFVNDPSLIRDMIHTVRKLKSNVVLFPEAGYSFDGTATVIPETVGGLIKHLGIPVVMITTYGAFSRDPLYNNIQVRKVDVSAREEYILSPDDIKEMSASEIFDKVNSYFAFDSFRWQQENSIKIDEPFRADYLNRILYKCKNCLTEGQMHGEGETIVCRACKKTHRLTEYGYLEGVDSEPDFTHIPDWYRWERECVREELLRGEYSLNLPVDIMMTIDLKKLYRVGEGRLTHTTDGIRITGCDGKLDYEHKPLSSYTLNSDFNWYEIGDMIGVGNHKEIYYCFPKEGKDVVAKARLAGEELYKILMENKREKKEEELTV